jgi:hypothetical protein
LTRRKKNGEEEEPPHKIIRQKPERPQMQNIGDGTQKEARTKSHIQN